MNISINIVLFSSINGKRQGRKMQKFRTGSKNCHRVCKCWGPVKAMQDALPVFLSVWSADVRLSFASNDLLSVLGGQFTAAMAVVSISNETVEKVGAKM